VIHETLIRVTERLRLPRNAKRAAEIRALAEEGNLEAATRQFLSFGYGQFRNVTREKRESEKQDGEVVSWSDVDETRVAARDVAYLRPSTAAEMREFQAAIATALAKLPEKEREVILGRTMGGIATAEMAELLECSEGSIRAYQSRALARLARLLQKWKPE